MANDIMDKAKELLNTPDTTAEFDAADIEKNKWLSILSYLWILFFIPLLVAKDSRFARYHVNQGIVLAIGGIVTSVVASVLLLIPVIGVILGILFYIVDLAFLALTILGIYNVVQGKAKELPILGKFRILK